MAADSRIDKRANELYWSSDRSVNSIAEDLGLSKGRLYEVVRPIHADRKCPRCQSDLVFENRTARDQDEPACPMCDGTQVPLSSPGPGSSAATAASTAIGATDGSHEPGVHPADGSTPISRETTGVLAGLLVGAAAGILLGRFLGR